MTKKISSALLLVVLAGCAITGPQDRPFGEYYYLMNDRQRVEFGALRTDDERNDFIAREGLDVGRQLDLNLRKGMTEDDVREKLGAPRRTVVHVDDSDIQSHPESSWFYRKFNQNDRQIVYAVNFKDHKVTSWSHWIDR